MDDNKDYGSPTLWAIFGVLVYIAFVLSGIAGTLKEVYSDTHWMTGELETIKDNVEYIYSIVENRLR